MIGRVVYTIGWIVALLSVVGYSLVVVAGINIWLTTHQSVTGVTVVALVLWAWSFMFLANEFGRRSDDQSD